MGDARNGEKRGRRVHPFLKNWDVKQHPFIFGGNMITFGGGGVDDDDDDC